MCHYPILVLGNKCDLVEQRVVSRESGEMLASSLSAAFFEVSAKTGENIDKVYNSCNCNCIHTSLFYPSPFQRSLRFSFGRGLISPSINIILLVSHQVSQTMPQLLNHTQQGGEEVKLPSPGCPN